MTWDKTEFDIASRHNFNVYASWERNVRTDVAQGGSGPVPPALRLFQPVYAQVNLAIGADVVTRICALVGRKFLIPDESMVILRRLHDAISAGTTPAEIDLRFFYYRPEEANYRDPEPDGGGAPLFHVLRVGLAVPRSRLSHDAKSDIDKVALGTEVATAPVVTAVIDDSMGVANARFRKADGTSTRVAQFWKQELEGFSASRAGAGVTLGQTFDAAELDEMFKNAGSEDAFYRNLYDTIGVETGLSVARGVHGVLLATLLNVLDCEDTAQDPDTSELLAFVKRAPILDLWQHFSGEITAEFEAFFGALADTSAAGKAALCAAAEALLPLAQARSATFKLFDRMYRRPFGDLAGHGTAVLDLAAGADPGEADDAPIFAVELPALATAETNGARLEVYALQAMHRILAWADSYPGPTGPVRVPVVVNLSYGISAGPKDGTGFLEAELAALVAARNAEVATVLVMPAGNNYRSQLTSGEALTPSQKLVVEWRVLPDDRTPSFAELRLDRTEGWEVRLETPTEDVCIVRKSEAGKVLRFADGNKAAVFVQNELNSDGALVTFALAPTYMAEAPNIRVSSGTYRIVVTNTEPTDTLRARLDVQRDDTPTGYAPFGQQGYADDAGVDGLDPITKGYHLPKTRSSVQRRKTLSALATSQGEGVVVVGATFWDDHRRNVTDPDSRPPTPYTASGETLMRRPDVSAIAETGRVLTGVLTAGPYSGSTRVLSGTSAAAPQVSRAIAAHLKTTPGAFAKADALRAMLPSMPSVPAQPDPRLGFGTLPIDARSAKRRTR